MLKVLELRHKQGQDGNLGLVRLSGKDPQVIPAGHTIALEGLVNVRGFFDEKCVVVEQP